MQKMHSIVYEIWGLDLGLYNKPPDKSVYWTTIFFISHPKHMLWVLK